jgi:peptidoglycan/LPS O-acetylase OafA/YrhL
MPQPHPTTVMQMQSPTELPGRSGLAYLPGLTGIRAFAVLAVVVYHSGLSWLPGGFYGVDTFFTLSGFLIASLLLAEWNATGSVSLSSFWARRARRLLPGLFVMMAAVGAATALWPAVLASPHERSDALATLFYVANWHFIAEHSNYFVATAQPSPFLHTWSLAIEEQFYILWPLLVLFVFRMRLSPGAKRAVLGAISLAGAGASALAMALFVGSGGDTVRAYYGTDTRAQSILIGAALAIFLSGRTKKGVATPWQTASGTLRSQSPNRTIRVGIGLAGAATTAVVWSLVSESSPLAFRGGFALVSLGAAAVIYSVTTEPGCWLARSLSWGPVAWLGKISYGVYLWYWPTLLVVDGRLTGLGAYPLFLVRLCIVVVLAALSYYLVEAPIRRGALGKSRELAALPAGALGAIGAVFASVSLAAPPAFASIQTKAQGLPPRNIAAASGVQLGLSATAKASIPDNSPASSAPGTRGSHPKVRVLMVGDSLAASAGVGIDEVASRYGIELINEGAPGCSLGMDGDFRVLWYTAPPGPPCRPGDPAALLSAWGKWVKSFDPDVVVYWARGDLFDQFVGGKWEHIGEPGYNKFLEARLASAVSVLSSLGARVVLMTSPYFDSGESPSGSPWPEDSPQRVASYNAVLAKVAVSDPDQVTVIDAGQLLSPGGRFAAEVDGTPVRCTDGVHLSPQGGVLVGTWILPTLAALGSRHVRTSHAPASPPLPYGGPPAWYLKLDCP